MWDKIHWLGHSAFRLQGKSVVYIDPFKLKDGLPPADVILITHDHYDHCSPGDIAKIKKAATRIVAPPSCAALLEGPFIRAIRGQTLRVNGLEIQVFPAYNIGKKFHPQSSDNVGYVIHFEGLRVYHSGDTDLIPEMRQVRADMVFLPCGGTYTMTADEAAKAVEIIQPKAAVPMHWGTVVGTRSDAERFVLLCSGCEAKVLTPVK